MIVGKNSCLGARQLNKNELCCVAQMRHTTHQRNHCARNALGRPAWPRPLRPPPILNGELCRQRARRSVEPFSSITPEAYMLTLAELQSTLQIEYELQLEAMDEIDPVRRTDLQPAI
jgi:hypothetical protein